LGTLVEMATMAIPGINQLPEPLATVVFHYSQTQDYRPEFASMVAPNNNGSQVATLHSSWGARPAGLPEIAILATPDKVAERRAEFPGIDVRPLVFASSELDANAWRFLMGAVGNQALYLRQVNQLMRSLRGNLSVDSLAAGIEHGHLPDNVKELARARLELARAYIDDSTRLSEVLRPGRLVIVDLRDEFIEKDEALGLFLVLMRILANATHQGKHFDKLVVFDEAHKYIDNSGLLDGLLEVVREMRHKHTSILVASQDPLSVPTALIELSTQIVLHRMNSPAWLKHVQKANAALSGLAPEQMARLRPGEAFVWSSESTDVSFQRGAVRLVCRPRVTCHGGGTKTAV